MRHILHFIHGLNVGGAETFIVNIIRHLDLNTFCFDFAIQNAKITNHQILNMITDEHIKIFTIPSFPHHPFAQYRALNELLAKNYYDIVHIHMNAAINPIPLLVSRHFKKVKFIIHSHSISNSKGIVGKWLHYLNSRLLINESHVKVACSKEAGKWMFGNRNFSLLNNAIDTNEVHYNSESRLCIRREFNIPNDAKVIGSIGRFVYAKNHQFIIEIFNQYLKRNPDTFLLLVGDGELFKDIMTLANKNGVNGHIVFTGMRTDVSAMLSTMDCFLFPSHFEGLGFTAIEAESTGLYVVASNNVPSVINIKGFANFLSLTDSIEKWINAIDNALVKTSAYNREVSPITNTQYDIDIMTKQLESIYLHPQNII